MPYLHHKVGRHGGHRFLAARRQRQRHTAVRTVGVDHATGMLIKWACGPFNRCMNSYCFNSTVAADLRGPIIQPGRVEKTQAGISRCDQVATSLRRVKSHADVVGRGVHVAANKQATTNAAVLLAGTGFSQNRRHISNPKSLLKKSLTPRLPDFSARWGTTRSLQANVGGALVKPTLCALHCVRRQS